MIFWRSAASRLMGQRSIAGFRNLGQNLQSEPKNLRLASVDWHVDETCVRVGGKWRYLWRATDANGQMVDFRLTARRDAKAAKAFLHKAIERVRLYRPVTIVTDKAQAYRRVIREINHRYDPHFDSIRHVDRKWRNNLIEGDHEALKRLLSVNS